MRKKPKFTTLVPRSSMLAGQHRFTYRDKTNKRIKKIK